MKTLSTGFLAHLSGGNTTLCTAWRITRADAVVEGYTDHVEAITVDGTVCEVSSAYRTSNMETRAELSVANLEVQAVLDSTGLAGDDLNRGVYDYAQFEVFLVNYAAPTQYDTARRGWFGEQSTRGAMAMIEARGMAQALQQRIGIVTTPACRADLGDVECGVSLATWTATGTLTSVADKVSFRDSAATSPPAALEFGTITFSTGAVNAGQQMEVKSFSASGGFELSAPLRQTPATGDAYSCYAGCNKLATTCRAGFDNIDRIRAEIFLVGSDELSRFGRQ